MFFDKKIVLRHIYFKVQVKDLEINSFILIHAQVTHEVLFTSSGMWAPF